MYMYCIQKQTLMTHLLSPQCNVRSGVIQKYHLQKGVSRIYVSCQTCGNPIKPRGAASILETGQITVAINDLLCMKNAGAQIAMDFS